MIELAGARVEEESWLGNQDSNLGLRIQSPLSYH